jgi:hypothetical protein
VKSWHRLLWGVEFTGSRTDDDPVLIGRLWADEWAISTPYPGEPTRALLFTTRELARQWCAETMAKWRDRRHDDCVSRWRVRAVRVRETVQQVESPNVRVEAPITAPPK